MSEYFYLAVYNGCQPSAYVGKGSGDRAVATYNGLGYIHGHKVPSSAGIVRKQYVEVSPLELDTYDSATKLADACEGLMLHALRSAGAPMSQSDYVCCYGTWFGPVFPRWARFVPRMKEACYNMLGLSWPEWFSPFRDKCARIISNSCHYP